MTSAVVFGTYAIGFDIGQSNMRGSPIQNVPARMDRRWSRSAQLELPAEPWTIGRTPMLETGQDPKQADIGRLLGLIQEFIAKQSQQAGHAPEAVGVAIASSVLNGRTIANASTPFQTDKPFAQTIEASTGLPTVLINDGNAFALAEGLHPLGAFGDLKAADKSVLGVVLGTSVGGGLIYKGRLFQPDNFTPMVVGRMVIDISDTARKSSGKTTGSWSLYASGSGLRTTLHDVLRQAQADSSQQPYVQEFLIKNEKQSIGELTASSLKTVSVDNPLRQEILSRWQRHVAVGLANLVHITGVTNVVVGGGPYMLLDFSALEQDVKNRLNFVPEIKEKLMIRPARLNSSANQLGAMIQAAQTLTLQGKASIN